MFYILKTTDRLSGNYYFNVFQGNVEALPTDPHRKFKPIKLEDGTDSVITELHKAFGTKNSLNRYIEDLPNFSNEVTLKNPTTPRVDKVTPEIVATIEPVEMKINEELLIEEEPILEEPVVEATSKKRTNKKK